MWSKIVQLFKEEEGISSVEYALLLALIGVAIATAAGLLGTAVSTRISTAATTVNGG